MSIKQIKTLAVVGLANAAFGVLALVVFVEVALPRMGY